MARDVGSVHVIDFDVAAGVTNQGPTVAFSVPTDRALTIVVQADTLTRTENASTSVDLNVEASLDGSIYDTVPWASILALGNDSIQCLSVTPGVKSIRLKLDNNDGLNDAYVRARVLLISD